jgi:hypothetical protein
MPTKRINDLTSYTSILPYASELFGIYQPLLGWKSKRMEERFNKGLIKDKSSVLDKFKNEFDGAIEVNYEDGKLVDLKIKPGALISAKLKQHNSFVLENLSEKLPPFKKGNNSVWSEIITPEKIGSTLELLKKVYFELYQQIQKGESPSTPISKFIRFDTSNESIVKAAFEDQLKYESAIAGTILFLIKNKRYQDLESIFYRVKDNTKKATELLKVLNAENTVDAYLDISNIDPQDAKDIGNVFLSPISVVHLFRQYFFELDSFLGTPVSHVWLSPGSSVELIEVQTKRTIIEKSLESMLDTVTRSEKSTTDQEEISDAVKTDNEQDIKLGAQVSGSYGTVTASASFDYNSSQKVAREETHKRMRQQTEKLSSEIHKNIKSTFKTITELTDSSSKKYVLSNTTHDLINYEMRRKMRQVGVQVQDIGTYLCWQTYVDDPGRDLGIAKLIHIAKPADLDGIPHPEEIPLLQPFSEDRMVSIPFIDILGNGADNVDEVYVDGRESDGNLEDGAKFERIQADHNVRFVSPRANYQLRNVEFDPQGKPVTLKLDGGIRPNNNEAEFTIHLSSVDFQGQNSIQVKLTLFWYPTDAANEDIKVKNEANNANFKSSEEVENKKAFVESVKERVTLESKIASRKSDELREEERIVVYRKLIQDMLSHNVSTPDDQSRHVVAELINSIFDVDKMLYFVAPEWWRPRLHYSSQQLTEKPPMIFPRVEGVTAPMTGLMQKFNAFKANQPANPLSASTVGWGGINDSNRDNYFITEDSEPAKLGSSLGWLLQLDGDNMRNAFLNAPWVKAVMPIRPGKEKAAINWLKGVEGFNGIDDSVKYNAAPPITDENGDVIEESIEKDVNGVRLDGQPMIDVLMDLAEKIKRKHEQGVISGKFPKPSEVADPQLADEENQVTSTPIDRVYEHGFYPLQNSFKANVGGNYEIFDQWIEVLPTDQIVPVSVKYDPKTGRQV